jgi:hypothetical protein
MIIIIIIIIYYNYNQSSNYRIIERRPSRVCPLECGPNCGKNRIVGDRIIEWRL